jgi:hypothetical protein
MSSNRTLTHEQTRQYLQAAADGQLDPTIQPALERHLADCPQCQRFAERLDALEARLTNELPTAWPTGSSAEHQVASTLEKIHRQTRHTPMKTFLSNTARTLAFGLGILVLISGLAWGIRTLRPDTVETEPMQQAQDTLLATGQITAQVEIATPVTVITEEPLPLLDATAPGLFPTTSFDFPTGFPASLDTVNLYRLQLPEAVTPENALQMAARLGVAGGIYSLPGEGFDQVLYEVSDGFELLRFLNFAEQFVFETGYADPISSGGAPLPYDQQLRIATDFLNSQGLLDLPYQASPSAIEQGVVLFTPLLDGYPLVYGNGQNPGNMAWISVQVNPAGEVSQVMYNGQRFELLGEYPILTAQQAWERLSEANASQRVRYAVVPAEQPNTYRLWKRTYPQGQTVDLIGFVQARQPVDPANPVLISFNNYLVAGGEGLSALEMGTTIHAWGQFLPDEQGRLVFHIENWEISPIVEKYAEGTIHRVGDQGQLVTENGTLILPELPADVPDGWQVFASGILQEGDPATLNWYQISGGEYPNSYYTSSSCGGGGGGGGGGGAENVNFGGGSFAIPRLEPGLSPTATPEPGPYVTGDVIDGLTGRVYAINHLYSDGTTTYEFNLLVDPTAEAAYGSYFRLEGAAVAGLEQYQELPVRIWGLVTGNFEGTPIITLGRYEAQYPGLFIQQWNGTEAIINLEGQDVVLLTADSGDAFVLQSSLTWGAEGNLIGRLGDWIEIEGYLIPERQFGGYPVIQDLSGGMPPDGEVTSDDMYLYDHSFDSPDVNTLMAGQVTIDTIELAYASITLETCLSSHSTDPNMLPFLTVQPVWVFTGHFDDGRIIVIQVQALPEEYLQ